MLNANLCLQPCRLSVGHHERFADNGPHGLHCRASHAVHFVTEKWYHLMKRIHVASVAEHRISQRSCRRLNRHFVF